MQYFFHLTTLGLCLNYAFYFHYYNLILYFKYKLIPIVQFYQFYAAFSFFSFTLKSKRETVRIETDRVRKRHLRTKYHFSFGCRHRRLLFLRVLLSEMQLSLYSDYLSFVFCNLRFLYTYTNTHIYIYVKFKKHFVSYMQCARPFPQILLAIIPIPPACKQSLEILSVCMRTCQSWRVHAMMMVLVFCFFVFFLAFGFLFFIIHNNLVYRMYVLCG